MPRPALPDATSADAPARPRPSVVPVVLTLVACTAIGEALHRWLDPVNVVMVYLAGLVYVSLRMDRRDTLLMGGGSLLLFDLLFVEPRWSLKPTDPQYFLTFAVMGVVGTVISRLAEHSRAQTAMAEARARRAQALNQLALRLAAARDAGAVGAALEQAVRAALHMGARLVESDQVPASAPADTGRAGSPLRLPLLGAEGQLGWVELGDPEAHRLGDEDQGLLRAFASQAAVALERVRFERLSTDAALVAEGERLRNTLLAGISHDFRTPLTTIIGAASSLLEQDAALSAAQRRSLLQQVLGEAQRLHALGSDLLDITRLQEGTVRAQCEWCPLDELVHEAWQALGSRTERHVLQLLMPADQVLWCDPRLLGQALGNLLDNALRHSPGDEPVTVEAAGRPGELRLSVRDRGPGLTPGQERLVFEKFHRAGGDGASQGTGLGLAICAAVATLHGGTISARNEAGACFEMRLPQPDGVRAALDEGGDA